MQFGERVAFSDMSFEVGPGRVFGLQGPNGAVTTLLAFNVLPATLFDRERLITNTR